MNASESSNNYSWSVNISNTIYWGLKPIEIFKRLKSSKGLKSSKVSGNDNEHQQQHQQQQKQHQ